MTQGKSAKTTVSLPQEESAKTTVSLPQEEDVIVHIMSLIDTYPHISPSVASVSKSFANAFRDPSIKAKVGDKKEYLTMNAEFILQTFLGAFPFKRPKGGEENKRDFLSKYLNSIKEALTAGDTAYPDELQLWDIFKHVWPDDAVSHVSPDDTVKEWFFLRLAEALQLGKAPYAIMPEESDLEDLDWSSIKAVRLPDDLLQIDMRVIAEEQIILLENVYIPPGTAVGEFAFEQCGMLKNINLPRALTHLNEGVFHEATSLLSVTLPPHLKIIGVCAFQHCFSLKTIFIPDGVTHIHDAAFDSCKSLEDVRLPASLTTLKECAFYGCKCLEDINLEKTKVSSIGEETFARCSRLRSIKFPETLTSIDKHAFLACVTLSELDLSATVLDTIGTEVFGTETANEHFPDWAYQSSHLKSIKLPVSVTKIAEKAFVGCPNLKRITIVGGTKDEAEKVETLLRKSGYNGEVKLTPKKESSIKREGHQATLFSRDNGGNSNATHSSMQVEPVKPPIIS